MLISMFYDIQAFELLLCVSLHARHCWGDGLKGKMPDLSELVMLLCVCV